MRGGPKNSRASETIERLSSPINPGRFKYRTNVRRGYRKCGGYGVGGNIPECVMS